MCVVCPLCNKSNKNQGLRLAHLWFYQSLDILTLIDGLNRKIPSICIKLNI